MLLIGFFLLFPQISYGQVQHKFSLTPYQKAEALLARGNYDAAILAYKNLISDKKNRGYVVRGLVKAYRGVKRITEAAVFLNHKLAKASNPSDFLYGLGYLHYLEEHLEDAELFLREAVKANTKNALARNNLAAILSETQRSEEALQQVKKALVLNPREAMFFQNLFLIYRNVGEIQRFKIEFEDYRSSGEKTLAFGYGIVLARNLRQKGFYLYSRGQVETAVATFEEMEEIFGSIEHTPGLAAAWFSLGLLHEEEGNTEKALEYFEKILSISPKHIQARERLNNLKK